jgi:hypothetical protein
LISREPSAQRPCRSQIPHRTLLRFSRAVRTSTADYYRNVGQCRGIHGFCSASPNQVAPKTGVVLIWRRPSVIGRVADSWSIRKTDCRPIASDNCAHNWHSGSRRDQALCGFKRMSLIRRLNITATAAAAVDRSSLSGRELRIRQPAFTFCLRSEHGHRRRRKRWKGIAIRTHFHCCLGRSSLAKSQAGRSGSEPLRVSVGSNRIIPSILIAGVLSDLAILWSFMRQSKRPRAQVGCLGGLAAGPAWTHGKRRGNYARFL